MRLVTAKPLTAESFAPFGDVLQLPTEPGRHYYDEALANLRGPARASLSLVHIAPSPDLPFTAKAMERHEYSSQSFVPLSAGQYLLVVAPHHPDGGPALGEAQAFLARGDQGITYRANVWHHGMTALGQPATFAIFMWRDGGAGDEELLDVEPFTVFAPGAAP